MYVCAYLLHENTPIIFFLSSLPCSNKRYADFEQVQRNLGVPAHQLLRGVDTRWLSILPALERLWEQYPALLVYFDAVSWHPGHPDVTSQACFADTQKNV